MSNEAPAAGDGRRSQRALIALLVTVAAVVIVALIAVLTRGGPAQYAEGSPEGVVQRYVQAVTDGDRQTALALLTPTIAEECQRLEPSGEDYRVTLTGASEEGDSARVDVMVTTYYDPGLLGSGEFQQQETFELTRVDGAWRLENTPWMFAVCMGATL